MKALRYSEEVRKGLWMAIAVCDDIEKNSLINAQHSAGTKEAQSEYDIGIGAHKVKKILMGIMEGTEEMPKDYREY